VNIDVGEALHTGFQLFLNILWENIGVPLYEVFFAVLIILVIGFVIGRVFDMGGIVSTLTKYVAAFVAVIIIFKGIGIELF